MTSLVKPFAALWRARAYVIAGVVTYLLSFVPWPYKDADPQTLDWWQLLLSKALGSLDKIGFALLLAGLVYAVLTDLFEQIWSNKLGDEFNKAVSEISGAIEKNFERFVSGLGRMSFEAVKVWIEKGQAQSGELRTVGASSLKTHFGPHLGSPGNFVDFVLESVVDVSARADAQTWEGFNSRITIRKGGIPDHFQWEERRFYSVLFHAQGCTVPINTENSWQIGPTYVQGALKELDYNVEIDNQPVVNVKTWIANHADRLQGQNFHFAANGIMCSYDGVWLKLAITKAFPSVSNATRVTVYERSHLSQSDRCHALFLRHPTRGVQLSLTLEGLSGWVVKQPIASAQAYKSGTNVVGYSQPHLETASVDMVGWTLPGLAVVTEWTPV
jgi:hypothetical protein